LIPDGKDTYSERAIICIKNESSIKVMDDIDHLIANSSSNSFMFYIDSRHRNRSLYPNPNEYAIQFSTPFRNVYSIQVVDSLIPRTHYNVDVYSNHLSYTISYPYEIKTYEIDVPIGNYSADQLMILLNTILVQLNVSYVSYPGEVRKQFVFKSDYPFEISLSHSTMNQLLGFDATESNQPWTSQRTGTDDVAFYDQLDYLTGLNSPSNTHQQQLCNDSVLLIAINVPSSRFGVRAVRFNITAISEPCVCVVSLIALTMDGKTYPTNHHPCEISIDENTTFVNAQFDDNVILTNEQAYVRLHFKNFKYGTTSFSCTIPSSVCDTQATQCLMYEMTVAEQSTLSTNNIEEFASGHLIGVNIICHLPKYSLIPPGMYDLTGDNYINMRCKEIENHMGVNGNRVESINDNQAEANQTIGYGLAKFKLGIMGYQDERFDYVALNPREIHPIGKLSQLTFRFERWDGSLYNFRGVNHTMTLIIHYYSPRIDHLPRSQMISRLNPAYDASEVFY
jgi:hypothetical protein